jgi:hypothetical protein
VKKCILAKRQIDFRQALENEFSGAFSDSVFAIADCPSKKNFLDRSEILFFRPAIKFDPTGLSS